MADTLIIESAFKKLSEAIAELRTLNVFTNQKDLTCQLGEWLIASLYDGERAVSGIQKDWDVKVGTHRIQVKAHAKAKTTKARYSQIKYNVDADIDELVIIVFSNDYKLREFYKLSWEDALPLIKRNKDRDVINWNNLRAYKKDTATLPKQEIIALFQ